MVEITIHKVATMRAMLPATRGLYVSIHEIKKLRSNKNPCSPQSCHQSVSYSQR